MNVQHPMIIRRLAHGALLLCVLGTTTGCLGTVDARWAKESDTADAWGPRMATLPVVAISDVPGLLTPADVARLSAAPATGLPSTSARQAHVSLYASAGRAPTDDTLCQPSPAYRPSRTAADKVLVTAALCDGTRLVANAKRTYPRDHLTGAPLATAVSQVETRLMDSLAPDPRLNDVMYNG